jgi:hypothetical protein
MGPSRTGQLAHPFLAMLNRPGVQPHFLMIKPQSPQLSHRAAFGPPLRGRHDIRRRDQPQRKTGRFFAAPLVDTRMTIQIKPFPDH